MREIRCASGLVALVDDEDYAEVAQYRWHITSHNRNGAAYAVAHIHGRRVQMHRFILKAEPGQYVDHINGNSLDNRRANLRFCTQSENMMNRGPQTNNTSGYKGVTRSKNPRVKRKWTAQIRLRGQSQRIGQFATAEEAALAYDIAARREYGDFAQLNFPNDVIGDRVSPEIAQQFWPTRRRIGYPGTDKRCQCGRPAEFEARNFSHGNRTGTRYLCAECSADLPDFDPVLLEQGRASR